MGATSLVNVGVGADAANAVTLSPKPVSKRSRIFPSSIGRTRSWRLEFPCSLDYTEIPAIQIRLFAERGFFPPPRGFLTAIAEAVNVHCRSGV
jgi:hypothetical protein